MKTPLEELLSIVEELKSKNQEIDTNGLEDWLNSVGIPKEKEQREELIKEAFVAGAECGEMFNNENRCFKSDAEQYYNEVIKPKY